MVPPTLPLPFPYKAAATQSSGIISYLHHKRLLFLTLDPFQSTLPSELSCINSGSKLTI